MCRFCRLRYCVNSAHLCRIRSGKRPGYNFLYWNNVSRAGDQVDLRINPNLLPPAIPSEPRVPAFLDRTTGFWAHGVNVGIAFNY